MRSRAGHGQVTGRYPGSGVRAEAVASHRSLPPAACRRLRSNARPCSRRWLSYGRSSEPGGPGVSARGLPTLGLVPSSSLTNARELPDSGAPRREIPSSHTSLLTPAPACHSALNQHCCVPVSSKAHLWTCLHLTERETEAHTHLWFLSLGTTTSVTSTLCLQMPSPPPPSSRSCPSGTPR